jgi:polysaccharide deacetylase family protein (PEP-CTERM system associated)
MTDRAGDASAAPGAAFSIDVEDWFHSENVKAGVARAAWDGCESRVERNTMRMLEILEAHRVRATFFVLGWVAERRPTIVRAIAGAGHEVASHGYGHELVYALTPEAFRRDVARARGLLEDLSGTAVRGYRAPCFSITDWAIPILRDAGYRYDSSMMPTLGHDRYGRLEGIDGRSPIVALLEDFDEVCVSCLPLGRRGVPWAGGGYFRLLPFAVWMRGVRAIRRRDLPYVFYIHPWEIDPEAPLPAGLSASNRFRQRVGLRRCEARLAAMAGALDWVPIAALLDGWRSRIAAEPAPRPAAPRASALPAE